MHRVSLGISDRLCKDLKRRLAQETEERAGLQALWNDASATLAAQSEDIKLLKSDMRVLSMHLREVEKERDTWKELAEKKGTADIHQETPARSEETKNPLEKEKRETNMRKVDGHDTTTKEGTAAEAGCMHAHETQIQALESQLWKSGEMSRALEMMVADMGEEIVGLRTMNTELAEVGVYGRCRNSV